ncbi:MAG: DUF61 family protein [Asgard group archaeon]|nr:DUF61 family protein [Asgard group archaeon]
MSEKILDLIWSLDIEKMNDHLPAERRSLKKLMKDEKPEVKTKKNQTHRIRKKDLELVSQFIPENEWDNVKLPIILLRRTSLDKGIFSVSGGKRELYIIHKLVGRTNVEYQRFLLDDHQPYIWKPEAFTAVKKASSIIIIGYT